MKRELSGDEVYYANSLILLVKNMLVVNFIARQVLIQFPFHIRFKSAPLHYAAGGGQVAAVNPQPSTPNPRP